MKNFDFLTEFELLRAIVVDYSQLFGDFSNTPNDLERIYNKIYQAITNNTLTIGSNIFEDLSKGLDNNIINCLSEFYVNVRSSVSTNLCTRIFIHNLSKKYNAEIDFRRLKPSSYPILSSDLSDVRNLFNQLYLDKEIKPPKVVNRWFKWPSSSYEFGKHKFLRYKNYVVAFDGSLIPITRLKMLKNKFFIKRSDNYGSILNRPDIVDGIEIDENKIPLISLKHDLLTGLEISSQLPKFISIIHQHNISIMEVVWRKKHFIDKLSAPDKKLVNKAADRLKFTISFVDKLAQLALYNKTQVSHPAIFVTQGGSGSGKSILHELASNISHNIVYASLDKARYSSFIYNLLVMCEHHCDDYIIISQFAHTLRDTILNYALCGNFNLFLDGTGTPYKNRYDHLIEIFKNMGYKTYILGVNAEFFIDGDNEAYGRIIKRFEGKSDHRALPWRVALLKHFNQPKAFLDAISDDNLDYAVMIDSVYPKECSYILAITMVVDEHQFEQLNNCTQSIHKIINDSSIIRASPFKFPIYGVKLQVIKRTQTKYKILLISDVRQFNNCMRKCLINFNSKGKEDLYFNNYKYLIPDLDLRFDII